VSAREAGPPSRGRDPTAGVTLRKTGGEGAGNRARSSGPGAGLAIALENLFPPLPGEVILPPDQLRGRAGTSPTARAVTS